MTETASLLMAVTPVIVRSSPTKINTFGVYVFSVKNMKEK